MTLRLAAGSFISDFAKNIRLYLQEGIVSFYSKYYSEWDVDITEELPKNGQVEWVEIIASGSILLVAALGGMFLYLYLFFKEKHYGTMFGCMLVWFISGGIKNAPIDNSSVTGAISMLFPNRYAFDIIRTKAFYLSSDSILKNYLILIGMVLIMAFMSYIALYKKHYKPITS